jgi:formiminotetrahydrofolate cyclodeaminase
MAHPQRWPLFEKGNRDMDEKLQHMSCADFTKALSSKVSVPGGGGAAALVGALGAALCAMTGQFTVGKKKYALYEADIVRMIQTAEDIRTRLLTLIDEDAAAFEPLARAYAIPREDPSREERTEQALQGAVRAPLEMMRQIGRAVTLLEEMEQKGSVLLISDVGCGALCCRAALESAALNVFVNTGAMRDDAFAQSAEKAADELLQNYVPRAEAVSTAVTRRIREGS